MPKWDDLEDDSDIECLSTTSDEVVGGIDSDDDEPIVPPAKTKDVIDDDESVVSDESAEGSDAEDIEDEPIVETEQEFVKRIVIIHPDKRMTSNILSAYETTELISLRATDISRHNNPMVDCKDLDDPIKMAERELLAKKCPLLLNRIVGEYREGKEVITYSEDWDPNEMMITMKL